MKVKFTIVASDVQRLEVSFPDEDFREEYELADMAYVLALRYLKDHPNLTLDDIDYDWEKIAED